VWREGRAIAMVDIGGGTFVRFGEAGARLNDLELLAISHLHPDHSADLPAFLWLSDTVRQRPLRVAGPSAGGQFPSVASFVERLFDSTNGAFGGLGGTVRQNGRGIPLDVTTIDAGSPDVSTVLEQDDLRVTARGVPHGVVGPTQTFAPSIAYRIEVGERSVVFGSDQNGTDAKFIRFAQGADLLVMHFAVSTEAPELQRSVHATPAIVGQIAKAAQARHLVLSHILEAPPDAPSPSFFSGTNLAANVAAVREVFSGNVTLADDLMCFVVP
jgi:ribonuclease BN (tRNA processing enzyme)